MTGYHDSSPYGGVTQTINTTIGQSYTLSLSLGIDNPDSFGPVSVIASAGSTSQTFTFNSSSPGSQWGTESLTFTATSTSTPISIVGNSTADGHYIGLDNVSVDAVPEPTSILGTITALGLGVGLKRQLASKRKDA